MKRGPVPVWGLVGFAFFFQSMLLFVVATSWIHEMDEPFLRGGAAIFVPLAAGWTITAAVYWNRWRVIEAFTSRAVEVVSFGRPNAGVAVWAIFIIFVYANYRGVLKLVGR